MLPRLRAHLPALRRALRRRRRLLAALAVAALVAALLPSLLPPSARGVEAVVARTDLPPGTVLEDEHLSTVRLAAELVPSGTATDVEQVRGRTTVLPLEEGTPLLPGMLEPSDAPTVPEGSALMTVPVPAPMAGHLRPGTRLELLSSAAERTGSAGIPAQVVEALGVVVGGSGNGEQMAANKVRGVRAALVWSEETAVLAREHNDANVVSVGGRLHSLADMTRFVSVFLDTDFSGDERHVRRIGQLSRYESGDGLPPLPESAVGRGPDA